MDFKNIDKNLLETILRQVVEEKLSSLTTQNIDFVKENKSGVISVKLDTVKVSEENRLDTGKLSDIVYTKDVLTLEESSRLGAGIMEMKKTTFDWTLNYDEIDYIIDGHLDIIINGEKVSADKGEMIFIPKGSTIKFSVPNYARFLYITYPADWNNQN
ncbi:cupin domain-containing protein [[Clostridium] colinum]|uniref:cupin domain-containing protein n=1 Tax=[Clostridium] colinum TaxID=36835 RepID=UPI002024689B|nr:cupin domain-containing protein [[Clostridium] colinum]